VEAVRGAIRAAERTGQRAFLPEWLGIMAEGLAESGRWDDALQTLDDAIALAERTDERGFSAELWRLRAGVEAKLDPGANSTGSEAALRRAMEIARTQGSIMFELRAADDLTRLLAGSGRANEASHLLEELIRRASALPVDDEVLAGTIARLRSLDG
jgi:predicted ATPase